MCEGPYFFAERNALSKQGAKGDDATDQIAQRQARGRQLKAEISALEAESERVKVAMEEAAAEIPNDSDPSSPVGDEDKAITVKLIGEKPSFSFPVKDHIQLGRAEGACASELCRALVLLISLNPCSRSRCS